MKGILKKTEEGWVLTYTGEKGPAVTYPLLPGTEPVDHPLTTEILNNREVDFEILSWNGINGDEPAIKVAKARLDVLNHLIRSEPTPFVFIKKKRKKRITIREQVVELITNCMTTFAHANGIPYPKDFVDSWIKTNIKWK